MISSFKAVRHWLQRSAYDHAAEEMAQLDDNVQQSVEGLHLWAFIAQKRGEWVRLESFGRKLQEAAPNESAGWFCVAESFHRRNRSNEAIEVIKGAERLFKNEAEFLYMLSRLNCGAGEVETALKLIDEASTIAPAVKDKALLDRDFETIWLQLVDNQ